MLITPITFPLEILDHIFSFLADDTSTWSTLKACSEAIRNPDFRGAVDRRLYTHVVVTIFRPKRRGLFYYSDLFQYLSRNWQVANYIRTLHIEIEVRGPSEWYTQVSAILRMLPSTLKGITLSSRTRTWSKTKIATVPIVWPALHETFRKAFLDCLCSPNLIEVTMHGIKDVPLRIFDPCAKLQRLSLRQVDCNSCAQFPPRIASLIIDRSLHLPTIISWAKMGHNLRSLSFRSEHEGDYPLLTGLFHSCSDTLIELELFFGLFHSTLRDGSSVLYPSASPPVLSPLSNLKQLTVWASISLENSRMWAHATPSIAQLVTTAPSLKRLILRIEAALWHVHVTATSDTWRPLLLLAEHPSLRHIELGIVPLVLERREITDVDIISSLMGVPELKKMCEESFLSMKIVE